MALQLPTMAQRRAWSVLRGCLTACSSKRTVFSPGMKRFYATAAVGVTAATMNAQVVGGQSGAEQLKSIERELHRKRTKTAKVQKVFGQLMQTASVKPRPPNNLFCYGLK